MAFGSYDEGDQNENTQPDDEADEDEILEINAARDEGNIEADLGGKDVNELMSNL